MNSILGRVEKHLHLLKNMGNSWTHWTVFKWQIIDSKTWQTCKENKIYQKQKPNLAKKKKKNLRKQDISLSMSWGRSERVIEREIAAAVSQKSSRRPGEEFKKGKGRRQVIYLKTSVSDNDVMLSSTSRPASLWDEGMSRTAPDTRLRLCPGIRRGSAINFLLSFIHAVVVSLKTIYEVSLLQYLLVYLAHLLSLQFQDVCKNSW